MRSARRRYLDQFLGLTYFVWVACNINFPRAVAQCVNGFERTCAWTHDEKSALKWVSKSSAGENYVELSNCKPPNCGVGTIQSPWLPPRSQDVSMKIQYKIYSTSDVYVRLNLMTETVGPVSLLSRTGNYAHAYPTSWSSKQVTIPAVETRHKLVLKAHIPYDTAFVAIKDVNLRGDISGSTFSATKSTVATPTEVQEEETTAPSTTNMQDPNESTDVIENVGDQNEEKNTVRPVQNEGEEEEEDGEVEQLESLRIRTFIGEEDPRKGYTTVVEPILCMYQ